MHKLDIDFIDAVALIRATMYKVVESYKLNNPRMEFITKDKTTNSWTKFRSEIRNNKFITSTDGCKYTIYGSIEDNIVARQFHDIAHIKLNVGFSYKEEELVCEEQMQQIKDYGEANSWSKDDIKLALKIIYIDIVGQAAYYKDNGKFLNHQKSFVMNMLYN